MKARRPHELRKCRCCRGWFMPRHHAQRFCTRSHRDAFHAERSYQYRSRILEATRP